MCAGLQLNADKYQPVRAGLHGEKIFGCVRDCKTVFQSGHTICISTRMRVPDAPHPCQHLILSVF